MKMKLVFGTNRSGFTFLELLVVIMLLGIIATIVVPNLQRRLPRYARQELITTINALTQTAWQRAIQTQEVHRVHFNFEQRIAQIQVATKEKDAKGQLSYKPAAIEYQKNYMSWKPNFEFRGFSIDGVQEMERGKKVNKIWFYLVPDGMSQQVTINIADTDEQRADGSDVAFGLVLNPFTAQFKVYDTFK